MSNLDKNFKSLFNNYISKGQKIFNKNKKLYLVSHIHFLVWCFFLLTPIIIICFNLRNELNYFYLAMNIILVFQWILFKGDCCISYVIKKQINKNYVMGDLFYMSIEGYYDIFKDKWNAFNNTFNNHYNKLSKIILLNLLAFMIVLSESNLYIKQKCMILLIFLLLKIIYINLAIRNILNIQELLK